MMRDHMNAMRAAAQQAQSATQNTRMGTISAYNPAKYSVKVLLQPSGVETGWLPIKTTWVGNSWGMQAGPLIGDLVTISFQEGDQDAGVVIGSLYNAQDVAMPVPSGELWIQHKSGSLLKFLNNGDVQITTSRDLLANVGRDMTATVTRNLAATTGGYAHVTATTEVTITAPTVNITAAQINLAGNITQTAGTGGSTGTSTMIGPVTVQNRITSNTEVYAQTTPLHTHQHVNGGGTGNSGNPTP
jgi:phage baseplate assembly protein gpV